MLLTLPRSIERKDPREAERRTCERRRRFEALFARSHAEMRARFELPSL